MPASAPPRLLAPALALRRGGAGRGAPAGLHLGRVPPGKPASRRGGPGSGRARAPLARCAAVGGASGVRASGVVRARRPARVEARVPAVAGAPGGALPDPAPRGAPRSVAGIRCRRRCTSMLRSTDFHGFPSRWPSWSAAGPATPSGAGVPVRPRSREGGGREALYSCHVPGGAADLRACPRRGPHVGQRGQRFMEHGRELESGRSPDRRRRPHHPLRRDCLRQQRRKRAGELADHHLRGDHQPTRRGKRA